MYSKKLAKAAIDVITESNLVFGDEYSTLKGTIKGKGAIIDELFYKLNRTQNKDYQRAVANDIAKQIIDRTVLEETYSIFAEQDAENIERAKRIVETMSDYRHQIKFDHIKGDIKYTKDNKWQGYALQWAAKDGDYIRRLTRRSFFILLFYGSFFRIGNRSSMVLMSPAPMIRIRSPALNCVGSVWAVCFKSPV